MKKVNVSGVYFNKTAAAVLHTSSTVIICKGLTDWARRNPSGRLDFLDAGVEKRLLRAWRNCNEYIIYLLLNAPSFVLFDPVFAL